MLVALGLGAIAGGVMLFGIRETDSPGVGSPTSAPPAIEPTSIDPPADRSAANGWDAPQREAEALAAEVRARPQDAHAKLRLAVLLKQLGREPEAGRLVLDAYRVAPEDPEIVFNASMYFIAKEDWAQAEQAIERMIRLQPENESARRTLVRIRDQRRTEESGRGLGEETGDSAANEDPVSR